MKITPHVDFAAKLQNFISLAQAKVDAYHARMSYNWKTSLSVEEGSRYVRVVSSSDRFSRSVYCFVDKTDGSVLKAAGWKAPAKGARGNIFDADPVAGVNHYGANYNK